MILNVQWQVSMLRFFQLFLATGPSLCAWHNVCAPETQGFTTEEGSRTVQPQPRHQRLATPLKTPSSGIDVSQPAQTGGQDDRTKVFAPPAVPLQAKSRLCNRLLWLGRRCSSRCRVGRLQGEGRLWRAREGCCVCARLCGCFVVYASSVQSSVPFSRHPFS